MTQLQWQQIEIAVASMTEAERERLALLIGKAPASSPPVESLGLFADEPELLDEVMEGVYAAREKHPLRVVD